MAAREPLDTPRQRGAYKYCCNCLKGRHASSESRKNMCLAILKAAVAAQVVLLIARSEMKRCSRAGGSLADAFTDAQDAIAAARQLTAESRGPDGGGLGAAFCEAASRLVASGRHQVLSGTINHSSQNAHNLFAVGQCQHVTNSDSDVV